MNRDILLEQINKARLNEDAKEIVRILQCEEATLLTKDDLNNLYVNTLCRAANDQFSRNLFKLRAIDIFYKNFSSKMI